VGSDADAANTATIANLLNAQALKLLPRNITTSPTTPHHKQCVIKHVRNNARNTLNPKQAYTVNIVTVQLWATDHPTENQNDPVGS